MKWIERKEITTRTYLSTTIDVIELFLELVFDVDGSSIYGYYYHNYPDIMNQNKWFIKGVVKKGKKGFFIKLDELEWVSGVSFRYIRITNKKVCDYLLKNYRGLRNE